MAVVCNNPLVLFYLTKESIMKSLLKLIIISIGLYSATSFAMTKKECEDAGGEYTKTNAMTGICTQKITAIRQPSGPILQITAEDCKKQGGVVKDGNCITITKFKTGQQASPSQTK
jgi:hypothetical protein